MSDGPKISRLGSFSHWRIRSATSGKVGSFKFPFYKVFKKPAHAISTFDFSNFDYYHHVDDEADKMDFNHMTNFINAMIPAIGGMVNSVSKEIKMNNE